MINKSVDQARLKRLGERIKNMRGERSLSQESLAENAGVHRTYIGMIERGEKNMTIVSAQKIASAFGISISELLAGFSDGK